MSFYGGKDPDEVHDLTPDELTSKTHEVASTVRALFQEGLPFFTKDAIRALVQQIDDTNSQIRAGQLLSDHHRKFRLPTLQGHHVEVDVETGACWRYNPVKSVMYMESSGLEEQRTDHMRGA